MIFRRDTVPNFLRAAGRTFLQLFRPEVPVFVPPDVALWRRTRCEQCPRFVPDSRQCAECTCFVDAKTLLTAEHCPVKRW